ncbi:MAG: NTP transferase domain-containing protein [Candidatus Binatia bacterium]
MALATKSPSPDVSAVILAAGRASRMGREKVLLPLGNEPLIRRSVRAASGAGAAEILVLVNPRNRDAVARAVADLPCVLVCNERYEEGIGCSIARGANAVRPTAGALLLMQGDQPLVDRALLDAMIERWRAAQPPYVAAAFGPTTTTPVLFARALLPELRALGGDIGARAVLGRHAGTVLEFPAWKGMDVDTEEDYASVRALVEGGAPRAEMAGS